METGTNRLKGKDLFTCHMITFQRFHRDDTTNLCTFVRRWLQLLSLINRGIPNLPELNFPSFPSPFIHYIPFVIRYSAVRLAQAAQVRRDATRRVWCDVMRRAPVTSAPALVWLLKICKYAVACARSRTQRSSSSRLSAAFAWTSPRRSRSDVGGA